MASTDFLTYYDVLGVAHNATASEIRSAYLRKAKEWHPDLNPGRLAEAHVRMQKINEAAEVLRDPQSRLEYDSDLNRSRASATSASDRTTTFRSQNAYGQAAAKRAEDMQDWDYQKVVSEAARTVWSGSKTYRQEEAGCGSTIGIGCAGWLLILSLVFPPGTFLLFLMIRSTFFPNGRFVGVGTVLAGVAFWLVAGLGVGALALSANNGDHLATPQSNTGVAITFHTPTGPIPAQLRHEGFEYSGAGNSKAVTALITSNWDGKTYTASRTITLREYKGGKAVFGIDDTFPPESQFPSLECFGIEEEWTVTKDGVFETSSSSVARGVPCMVLPAVPKPGMTWTVQTWAMTEEKDHGVDQTINMRIVGKQKVTLKGGSFSDALLVEGDGTEMVPDYRVPDGRKDPLAFKIYEENVRLHGLPKEKIEKSFVLKKWYVKEVGLVKAYLKGTQVSSDYTLTIEMEIANNGEQSVPR